MIYFTPLRPGTIRDIFSRRPAKKAHDPFSLPLYPDQCAQIWLDEASEIVRCLNPSEPNGLCHGWLCEHHNGTGMRRNYVPKRDHEGDMIKGILRVEAQALRAANREIIGGRLKIQFVDGVRMKSDPTLIKVGYEPN